MESDDVLRARNLIDRAHPPAGLDTRQRVLPRSIQRGRRTRSKAFLMALMTWRWVVMGRPGMRAPAAAGWPPPPNWLAMSLTFTFSLLLRRLTRIRSGLISSKTQATTTGSMARR